MDVTRTRRELVRRLRASKPPPPSMDLRSYVGSPAPVLGLSVPQMRAIVRDFAAGHRDLATRDVNRLAAAIWRGATFEEKCLAIMLLQRYERHLDDSSWALMDRWVDQATGWGLCDGLAAGPIASMLRARPERFRQVLTWTRAPSMWRRRASTYALRGFVQARELDRPFRLLERVLHDDESWVQRAVGTWLRECWKRDRRLTEAFLRAHVRGLPPVVITVATERAPKSFRAELRRRSKATRPRRAQALRRGR